MAAQNQLPVLLDRRMQRDLALLRVRQLLDVDDARDLALTPRLPGPQVALTPAPKVIPRRAPRRSRAEAVDLRAEGTDRLARDPCAR